MAYEPDDHQIKKEFDREPSSQWVITPTRIIERKAFFAPKPEVTTTATGTNATSSNIPNAS